MRLTGRGASYDAPLGQYGSTQVACRRESGSDALSRSHKAAFGTRGRGRGPRRHGEQRVARPMTSGSGPATAPAARRSGDAFGAGTRPEPVRRRLSTDAARADAGGLRGALPAGHRRVPAAHASRHAVGVPPGTARAGRSGRATHGSPARAAASRSATRREPARDDRGRLRTTRRRRPASPPAPDATGGRDARCQCERAATGVPRRRSPSRSTSRRVGLKVTDKSRAEVRRRRLRSPAAGTIKPRHPGHRRRHRPALGHGLHRRRLVTGSRASAAPAAATSRPTTATRRHARSTPTARTSPTRHARRWSAPRSCAEADELHAQRRDRRLGRQRDVLQDRRSRSSTTSTSGPTADAEHRHERHDHAERHDQQQRTPAVPAASPARPRSPAVRRACPSRSRRSRCAISKGVPVLQSGKRYRFNGRLTCVIDGKRRLAPKRARIDILNKVGKKT